MTDRAPLLTRKQIGAVIKSLPLDHVRLNGGVATATIYSRGTQRLQQVPPKTVVGSAIRKARKAKGWTNMVAGEKLGVHGATRFPGGKRAGAGRTAQGSAPRSGRCWGWTWTKCCLPTRRMNAGDGHDFQKSRVGCDHRRRRLGRRPVGNCLYVPFLHVMIFREHRASYVESLKTQVTLADNYGALLDHLAKVAQPWPAMPPINSGTVQVVPYAPGKCLVTFVDYGVLGYLTEAGADL